ncbi:MAG: hypothetical protein ABI877_10285 [Gemmatimonadaceae bacterium]
MTYRRYLLTALAALPAIASAQTLPARVVRHGSAGLEITVGEPVSFFIEHSKELELTDAQRDTLMALRRRLRAQNASYTRSLDSLREVVGIDLEPRPRGNDREREKLERFTKLSAPFADSIRVNNDNARGEAWLLLEVGQRNKVDSLVKDDRDARSRERNGQPPRRPPG